MTNRCIKNSLLASILGCMEAYLYKWLKTYEKTIDLIIAPSRFMREKMVEFGMELCPEIELKIIGEGELRGQLVKMVKDEGMGYENCPLVDGLLFDPRNVEDLAAKIQYLAKHREMLPEMGRHKIEEHYNSGLYYQKMMGIYEDVLRKRLKGCGH